MVTNILFENRKRKVFEMFNIYCILDLPIAEATSLSLDSVRLISTMLIPCFAS